MRNIPKIIAGDFKRLTSSVVAIVIIMGICIVPCLFTWFNILSNWNPFEPESTGRIPVAVVNEDKGADMLGLSINVGELLNDKLAANDMINWQFLDDEDKALEGTRAGDYYAAIVVPENFTEKVLSFTSGDLKKPKLQYYENDKKNAIAPKITGKVRSVLEEEINAAFVGTMAKYISEGAAAADNVGLDPEQVFGDLGNRMDDLSSRLDDCVMLIEAAAGLSDAANDLLSASGTMISRSEKALNAGENLLDAGKKDLPDEADTKAVSSSVKKAAKTIAGGLTSLNDELSKVRNDMTAFNEFVEKSLQKQIDLISKMRNTADKIADKLNDLGLSGLAGKFTRLSDRLGKIYDKLSTLETADEESWPVIQKALDDLISDIDTAEQKAEKIISKAGGELDDKINKSIKDAAKTIAKVRTAVSKMYGDLDTLDSGLKGSEKSLLSLSGGLDKTIKTLLSMQSGFRNLSELFESLSDSAVLDDVNHLLQNDADVIASRLAAPIQMQTHDIYPIDSFGSTMAAFYTALAQWIGALFAAVLIHVQVKRREGQNHMRIYERFFGRYRLFLTVGLIQALLVSLGDLLYVGIQCHHPFLFVLAACVNSIVFTLIIYSLVFALENIGLAVSVIVMILQVAGAGGLFPPEVLPTIFQKIFPFMPLHYAMDALRECIGGMYDGTYIKCLGILALFAIGTVCFGLVMHKPMLKVIGVVEESKKKSDLML